MTRLTLCILLLAGCDPHVSDEDAKPGVGGKADDLDEDSSGCRVFVHDQVAAAFSSSNDPFSATILGPAECQRTGGAVLATDLAAMLEDRGCALMGRALISEEAQLLAQRGGAPVFARGFDVWNCDAPGSFPFEEPNGKIYVGNFGNEPELAGYEIIAFDAAGATANFYTHRPGPDGDADFVYSGNSFVQAPAGLSGFPGSHPCTNCHVSGGLLIKETRFPWVNWHSHLTMPFLDTPGVAHTMLDEQMPAAFDPMRQADPGKLLIAEHVETLTLASAVEINRAKIERIVAGQPFSFPHESGPPRPFTVRDLMRPVLCEEELSLATSIETNANFPDATPSLPKDLFLSRLLQPAKDGSGAIVVTVAGEQALSSERPASRLDTTGFNDSQDFLDARIRTPTQTFVVDLTTAFPNATVRWGDWTALLDAQGVFAEAAAGAQDPNHRFGRVPFLVPARSFADDDFVSRLVNEAVVEERLVRAALMVDFTKPLFSRRRCGLLEAIPAIPVAGMTAPEITATVEDALAGTSSEAAAELLANLHTDARSLGERVMAYRNACRDARFNDDLEGLLALLRGQRARALAEAERFAIEPHVLKMFPEIRDDDERDFVTEHLDLADLSFDEQCRVRR